jgi:hypothetical protein
MPEDFEEEFTKEPTTYEELVTEEPEREVTAEAYESSATATETMEDAPQTSDIQAILKSLSPKSKYPRVNDLCQPAMVSRIFPDNLLDKNKLIVLDLVEEHEETDVDIPLMDYIMNTQDMLSVGYEGRGIVERLEIGGVVNEKEMEQMAKELGL